MNYECKDCEASFFSRRLLKKHAHQSHFDEKIKQTLVKEKAKSFQKEEILKCDFCGFSFDDQSKLQDHIDEIHLKLKSFQCEKCQRCFRGKFHLENHMNNIHTNLFKCSECEKSFSIISKLKRHENEVHLKAKV